MLFFVTNFNNFLLQRNLNHLATLLFPVECATYGKKTANDFAPFSRLEPKSTQTYVVTLIMGTVHTFREGGKLPIVEAKE